MYIARMKVLTFYITFYFTQLSIGQLHFSNENHLDHDHNHHDDDHHHHNHHDCFDAGKLLGNNNHSYE